MLGDVVLAILKLFFVIVCHCLKFLYTFWDCSTW